MWSATRSSTSSPCWSTSRWSWPKAQRRRTRYRLLETVRQYALEKLGESGEADAVRARHRDYYTAMAALLDSPGTLPAMSSVSSRPKSRSTTCAPRSRGAAKTPIPSSRLQLASSLQPLWLARGRIREGLAWFDAALTDQNAHQAEVAPAVRARALADKATLDALMGATDSMDQAQQALAIAREVDDPALLAPGPDRLRWHRGLRRRGGPAILRRGDRPGPRAGRRMETEPDLELAGVRGGHGG